MSARFIKHLIGRWSFVFKSNESAENLLENKRRFRSATYWCKHEFNWRKVQSNEIYRHFFMQRKAIPWKCTNLQLYQSFSWQMEPPSSLERTFPNKRWSVREPWRPVVLLPHHCLFHHLMKTSSTIRACSYKKCEKQLCWQDWTEKILLFRKNMAWLPDRESDP